jgi:hypothetical protein
MHLQQPDSTAIPFRLASFSDAAVEKDGMASVVNRSKIGADIFNM